LRRSPGDSSPSFYAGDEAGFFVFTTFQTKYFSSLQSTPLNFYLFLIPTDFNKIYL